MKLETIKSIEPSEFLLVNNDMRDTYGNVVTAKTKPRFDDEKHGWFVETDAGTISVDAISKILGREFKSKIRYEEDLTECIDTLMELEAKAYPDGYNGTRIDPDTFLADIMDNTDFCVSGLSGEIYDIYKKSKDKRSIETFFETMTGCSFRDYLLHCDDYLEWAANR